ncbi:Prohibitin [Tupaia chinensis]|uniref:Prohibitin n=1 Tax=Tupaia chinensis TaxID=246437 RepID=L9JBX1_TUPCH|nr:Prohibitin [Tupaia chinensis]
MAAKVFGSSRIGLALAAVGDVVNSVLNNADAGHRADIFDRWSTGHCSREGAPFLMLWVQKPITFDCRSWPHNPWQDYERASAAAHHYRKFVEACFDVEELIAQTELVSRQMSHDLRSEQQPLGSSHLTHVAFRKPSQKQWKLNRAGDCLSELRKLEAAEDIVDQLRPARNITSLSAMQWVPLQLPPGQCRFWPVGHSHDGS